MWVDHGLVFPYQSGGPLYGANVTKALKKVLKANGLPEKRFHDPRHTGATNMAALGADMRVIQEVLGHTDYGFTVSVYAHSDRDRERKNADAMGGFLRG
ncbi:MAG: tyrosine-type recombinase/integrase [Chloroflexi bacterium]|nr:tyrosine-type recombinase/integrase [Chloroflexota bacterium]